MKYLLCILILATYLEASATLNPAVVTISGGGIRGIPLKTPRGTEYWGFRAIPYAKPPIGDLRFKKPVPPEPWKGIRDGGKSPSSCPQYNRILKRVSGKEDCLYLDVFTPQLPIETTELLPVIVYVFGGGFKSGTINLYNPGKFIDRNVIWVMYNYRLGVLGQLSTGDDAAIGNYGLYDGIQALTWVQQNIRNFSGDPDRVTLMGQSAGSFSISLLLLSNLTAGLYQRAIMESGTVDTTARIFQKQPLKLAQGLANVTHCPNTSTEAMVACFRNVSKTAIINAARKLAKEPEFKPVGPSGPFNPYVTGNDAFLPIPQSQLLSEGSFFNKVPILLGNEGNDALLFVKNEKDPVHDYAKLYFQSAQPNCLDGQCLQNLSLVLDRIDQEYFCGNETSLKENNFPEYLRIAGMVATDVRYAMDPTNYALFWSSQNVTAYYYVMKYVGTFAVCKFLGIKFPVYDACHGDETIYEFDLPLPVRIPIKSILRGQDEIFSNRLMDLWTNFAKSGNPNQADTNPITAESTLVNWEEFEPTNQYYLEMDTNFTIKSQYRARSRYLWSQVLPKILEGIPLTDEEQKIAPCSEYLP